MKKISTEFLESFFKTMHPKKTAIAKKPKSPILKSRIYSTVKEKVTNSNSLFVTHYMAFRVGLFGSYYLLPSPLPEHKKEKLKAARPIISIALVHCFAIDVHCKTFFFNKYKNFNDDLPF